MKRFWIVLLVLAPIGCGSISAQNSDAGIGTGALALAAPNVSIAQGTTTPLAFTITGDALAKGTLTVHVDGLPAGVTADDTAGVAAGTITFAATGAATLGASMATVQLLAGSQMLDQEPLTVLVSGPPGSLDVTFGMSGRSVLPLPDPAVLNTTGTGYPRAMLVYPATAGADADKILIAVQLATTGPASMSQSLAVVRLDKDGTSDTTFGGGTAYALITGTPANAFVPVAIALDSQQRIVVMANQEATLCNIFVARLTATGAPDSGFTTFVSNPPQGFCGTPADLAILPGDKIITASTWNNPGADESQRPLFAQLDDTGLIDSTIFSSGYVRMPNPDAPAITKPTWLLGHMLVDAQGNYDISGVKCEGGYTGNYSACESVVGRVTAAGAWDATFGNTTLGTVGYSALTFGTTSNTNIQEFNAMASDSAGNIVAVGWNETYTTATMARFTSTGAIDNSFGTSGRLTPVLVSGGATQELDNVAIDAQNRILGIGYSNNGGPLIVATRYTSEGKLDMTYGTNGVTTEPAAGLGPLGKLQSDGRLIVVGAFPRGGSSSDMAVWRFWP